MAQKVIVDLQITLTILVEDGVNIEDVINEMDTNFTSVTGGAEIKDWDIWESEVREQS